VEVKQAAIRQTWTSQSPASPPRFDIRPHSGSWAGGRVVPLAGRYADIYVFAHHPITDASADHRDARQWQFYVVAASRLPSGKRTISLPKVPKLSCRHFIGGPMPCRARISLSLSRGSASRRWSSTPVIEVAWSIAL